MLVFVRLVLWVPGVHQIYFNTFTERIVYFGHLVGVEDQSVLNACRDLHLFGI